MTNLMFVFFFVLLLSVPIVICDAFLGAVMVVDTVVCF